MSRFPLRSAKPSGGQFKQTIKMPARAAEPVDCPEPGVPCYPFGSWNLSGEPTLEVGTEADLSLGFCFACSAFGGGFSALAATYTWDFDITVADGTIDAPTVTGEPAACFNLVFGPETGTGLVYLLASATLDGDPVFGPLLLVVRVVD